MTNTNHRNEEPVDQLRVLGIEGTAWAASAAVYDSRTGRIHIETESYAPESGGIHPREAAEHMHEALPTVIDRTIEWIDRSTEMDSHDPPVDVVAFSRGPGLGPCLRLVGSAARALSQRWDVPLVGVNHMIAHLEIARHTAGFDAPIGLNASGANAHLLAYRNGRYRILGETMDTGVGNAIDKFTRHVGWSHPGGPKVEQAASDGSYVDLPYVVKGMDFSFSGIMSAAKDAYDDGVPVEDVCFSLQETIFSMLTEVSERALSLTGRSELVLGGGVGQNARLQEMLTEMCEHRGVAFHVPSDRFLRDNAGMIAVLGARMYEAGDTVSVDRSHINPEYRPDQVPITWDITEPEDQPIGDSSTRLGAEATVTFDGDRVIKHRLSKEYRHPMLDDRLRRERTIHEARLTSAARAIGVPTPVILDIDPTEFVIVFERVGTSDLSEALSADRSFAVGAMLARIHESGFVHGDPTTRNVRVDPTGENPPWVKSVSREQDDEVDPATRRPELYCIDFGLGFYTDYVEDYAMDLHVYRQSLNGTAEDPEPLWEAAQSGYRAVGSETVLDQLDAIESRGRYLSPE